MDQSLGAGDGTRSRFDILKTYGSNFAPYARRITKPVAGSVLVAIDGAVLPSAGYTVDTVAGTIQFQSAPHAGAAVTAGFQFDVPVRFDTDKLEVNLAGFRHGAIPAIPLIEIRA